MPKKKKLLKLLNEIGVKQQVQRVELDRLADRKLPAREQKMRDIEDDLYFVLDERGHSVHLTDQGVETMSPADPDLFIVPDISHVVHEIEHDEASRPRRKWSGAAPSRRSTPRRAGSSTSPIICCRPTRCTQSPWRT